jgi:hypothetical protein
MLLSAVCECLLLAAFLRVHGARVGNESADIIGGKDFARSRCLLTRFQAGDGHDKAPESVKYRQWTMKSAPQCDSGRSCSPIVRPIAVMHLQIVEADRQLTRRYVASTPHSWAMLINAVGWAEPAKRPEC